MFAWAIFLIIILILLALDLVVFHRRAHAVSVREALALSAMWIAIGLLFSVAVFYLYDMHLFGFGLGTFDEKTGSAATMAYLTGYIVEKSLSLDNIFVFALIFGYLRIPAQYQHRVLYWGILGALVMRGIMIGAGTALIHQFEWVLYLFGILLLISAIRFMIGGSHSIDVEKSMLVRLIRRVMPYDATGSGQKFLVKLTDGRLAVTPLLLALVMIESSDVLFAVDSIPAVFAVTYDPFIVFTSNIFAILGLRSLYFALAGVLDQFVYLRQSLVIVLGYIAVKMLLFEVYKIPTVISLVVIIVILTAGVLVSMAVKRKASRHAD